MPLTRADALGNPSELSRPENDVSKTGVCGESIGLFPTNELSNQHFLLDRKNGFEISYNIKLRKKEEGRRKRKKDQMVML